MTNRKITRGVRRALGATERGGGELGVECVEPKSVRKRDNTDGERPSPTGTHGATDEQSTLAVTHASLYLSMDSAPPSAHSKLVSRYYPLSTMGPMPPSPDLDRKALTAVPSSSSIMASLPTTNGKPQEDDLEHKYKRLKTKYFELQDKFKSLEQTHAQAQEHIVRLKQEKTVYLDRILELENQPTSSSSSNAFPLRNPVKLNFPLLSSAFDESLSTRLGATSEDGKPPVFTDPFAKKPKDSIASQGSTAYGLRSRSSLSGSQPMIHTSSSTPARPAKRPRYSSNATATTAADIPPSSRPTPPIPHQVPGLSTAKSHGSASAPQLETLPLTSPLASSSGPHHWSAPLPTSAAPSLAPSTVSTPGPGPSSSQSQSHTKATKSRNANPDSSQLQKTTRPKRLRASNVSTKTHNIPKVPRDLVTGAPLLPLSVGIMTVYKLGVISQKEHFHTERYIFPVGYEVTRRYFSTKDPAAEVVYNCQILDGGDGPIFQIIAADMPDQPIIAGTATGAWSGIVRAANLIRSRQHSNSVSGPDFFGLGQNTIKHLIQELPGTRDLKNYVWQNFVEGGPLGGRHAAVVHAVQDDTPSESPAPSDRSPTPSHNRVRSHADAAPVMDHTVPPRVMRAAPPTRHVPDGQASPSAHMNQGFAPVRPPPRPLPSEAPIDADGDVSLDGDEDDDAGTDMVDVD